MIKISRKFIAAKRLLRDKGLLYLVKYTLQVSFQYPIDLVAYLRVSIAERLALGTISELLISGTPVAVNECNPSRKQSMADVVAGFQQPILALEIGTWFGKGSTQIWIKSLPKGSSLILMDSWRPYLPASDKKNSAIAKFQDLVPHNAILSTLRQIYAVENTARLLDILLIRGQSKIALSLLKEHEIDFIYIDGGHDYQNAKNDIVQSKRLINKTFGIICGDDLELAPSESLIVIARNNMDTDSCVLSDDGYGFHPGVCLAVYEEFGNVNLCNGFWWIFCKEGEFVLQ